LKLIYDSLVSSFAFNSDLHRYITDASTSRIAFKTAVFGSVQTLDLLSEDEDSAGTDILTSGGVEILFAPEAEFAVRPGRQNLPRRRHAL